MAIFSWLHPDGGIDLDGTVPDTPVELSIDLDLFVSGSVVTDGQRVGVVEFIDASPFYGDERFLAYVVSLPGTEGMDNWGDYWPLDAMWHYAA